MINHARTLLMNVNGNQAVSEPGEQYVPIEFSASSLPTYLQLIRSRLFGASPDRAMLNYRLAQYMSVLNTTRMRDFVTELDPRITYSNDNAELFNAATYQPVFYGPSLLSLQGTPTPPDAGGSMYFSYTLNLVNRTVTQHSPQQSVTPFNFTGTAGLSEPVSLPGSGYSVLIASPGGSPLSAGLFAGLLFESNYFGGGYFGTGVLDVQPAPDAGLFSSCFFDNGLTQSAYFGPNWTTLQGDQTNVADASAIWEIEFYNRPQLDIGSIAAGLRVIGEPTLLQLFGPSPVEPYATFANLFYQHPQLAWSLGGFLMAVIWRLNEIWKAGGNG